jgi:hypothetical protein
MLIIDVVPAGGGTTSPSPGSHFYPGCPLVEVYAYANPGYSFSHWEGDVGGTNNPVKIELTGINSITAVFTPVALGDLDCDGIMTGTDVLIQASMVVDLLGWEDLPECIASWDDVLDACDWDCSGTIDGTDVLIGSSIIVGIIGDEDTPLAQGCP